MAEAVLWARWNELITTDQERWFADDPVPLPAHGGLAPRELPWAVRSGFPGVSLDLDPHASTGRTAVLFAYDGLIFLDGEWAAQTFAGMLTDDQVTGRDFGKRGLMRTLITTSHKFSRDFAPGEHHRPSSMEELRARNTLEVFDLADPGETVNLALDLSSETLQLVEQLSAVLTALIDREVGDDDGHWRPAFPGAPWNRATK